MITEPGVYTMNEKLYHSDPCPSPSLSSSIARTLLDRSPLHAWTEHPRLNPHYAPEEKAIFDRGSAAHALLLEGENRMVVINAKDYRTDAAKEARDAARASGKHPILVGNYPDILRMRDIALEAIANCPDLSGLTLADGKAEQVMAWKEDGIWCRIRTDWLTDARDIFLDYKSTGTSGNPDAWVRTMTGNGGHVQGSFYKRGNVATGGPEHSKFIFLVQESEPPFACSFVGLAPAFIELADAQVTFAINTWRDCLTTGKWPGYPDRICWVEPPSWAITNWEDRMEQGLGGIPYDVSKMGWQHAKQYAETDPA